MRRALAALVVALCACSATAGSATVPRRSLVLVDEARGRVVGTLALGVEPMRVSYGGGAFWVVAPKARTIIRVDPKTRSVQRRRLGEEPYNAATGEGVLWVPDH